MRKIKFRGQTAKGKMVYGGLIEQYPNRRFIYDQIDIDVAAGELGTIIEVKPESVAQYINVDKDGNEIYEGDKVIRIAGEEIPMAATFEDFAAIRDGEIIKCVR